MARRDSDLYRAYRAQQAREREAERATKARSRYLVLPWRGDNRYDQADAVGVYKRRAPAERLADRLNADAQAMARAPQGYVVRAFQVATENPKGDAARDMFETFHGFEPDTVVDLPIPDLSGERLAFVGNLLRIDYDSPKWGKGRPGRRKVRGYWHESTGQPYILTNAAGNVLVIFDPTGKLRVTADGIEN